MLQPIKSNTIGTPYNGNMMAMGTGGPLGQPAQPDTSDPVRAPQMGNLFQQAGQPQQPATGAMGFDTAAAAGTMKDAGQVNVGDQSLVSKQITSLLSQDSPYIQLAKTRALQESNARGLANSSMAVGAGQAAAIDRALPIAQQDANTFATADRFNVEQGNLFSRDANNFGRESSLRKLGIFADMETQGRDQNFRAGESALERQFRTGERVGSQDFQSGENALDRRFRTDERIGSQEFQSGERRESQGFQSGENALDRTFRSGERIGAQEFQSGENALQRAFQTGERVSDQDFRTVQAVLDREQQLRVQQLQEGGMDRRQAEQIASQERSQKADQVFTGEQRQMDRSFQAGENQLTRGFQAGESELDRKQQMRIQELQDGGMDRRQAEQIAAQERSQASSQGFQAGENAIQRAFQTGERVSDQDFRGAQAVLDREQQIRVQQLQDTGMDRRQAEQIAAQERSQRADQVFTNDQRQQDRDFTAGQAGIEREFRTQQDAVNFSRELERMGFASKLEQSRLAPAFTLAIAERTQASVQAILADPNIAPEDKKVAIQNMVDYQNNTLAWAETFFGVNINKMPGGAPLPAQPGASQPAPPQMGPVQPPIFNAPGAVAPMPQSPATGGGNLLWDEGRFGALPQ